jgi:putative FmdB family regulatory protein
MHKCEFVFEVTHKITDDPLIKCPKCNSDTKRQIARNVRFETPVDVEWQQDPSDLTEKSFRQYEKAKKQKFRW